MGEARHADDSGSTKMDRNDGGSPITPTPQDPPRWTGAMGEAPLLRRLRTHLDGQELWESPNMPTPQDPAKWKGAMGEARHTDAPGPTKMDKSYGKAWHADDSGPTKMDRSYGGSPACRRSRTHQNGQELWESPNMPTTQDPPRWTGAMGKPRHADASGPT